jgi:hypothetical protein
MSARVRAARILERFFSGLEMLAQRQAMRFALCPECGRNRYSGRACKVENEL